ncbi:MAG TPA: hypothetical protein VEB21_03170 [Terriglobales bacterium]|nr:hypothetical protein [Terriglobales bacterium]
MAMIAKASPAPSSPSWTQRPIPSSRLMRFVRRWPFASAIIVYCSWVVIWGLYSLWLVQDHSADLLLMH